MPTKQVKAKAPAKLILSGEHSVIYGGPALSVAVSLYHTTHISHKIKEGCVKDESLQRILKEAATKFDINPLVILRNNKINIDSRIPIGAGMGSSAAYIVSTLMALFSYYSISYEIPELLECARTIEHWFHGRSSGVDVTTSFMGGALFFTRQDDQLQFKKSPIILKEFILIHTGFPLVSTKQCVKHVQERFSHDKGLWDEFSNITMELQHHLSVDGVRYNHKLLTHIGVVPLLVQQFIQDIAQLGGAAKICGAGATAGQSAGMVWAYHIEQEILRDLCSQKSYAHFQILNVLIDDEGAKIVNV